MKLLKRISTKSSLIGIILFGLIIRLLVVFIFPIDFRLQKDALEYLTVAVNLVDFNIFGVDPNVPYAKFPPGYPLLVSAIFDVFGKKLIAVRLIQVLFSLSSIWMVYQIGRQISKPKISLFSSFLFALYPPFVFNVIFYLTETLFILVVLIFWYFYIQWIKKRTIRTAILAGSSFAIALLVKETLIAFPLILPLLLVGKKGDNKKTISQIIIFAMTTLFFVSPWLIRNYIQFDNLFFTSRTSAIKYKITESGFLSDEFEPWYSKSNSPIEESDPLSYYYQEFGRTTDLWDFSFFINSPQTYVILIFNRLIEFWLHPNGLFSLPDIYLLRSGYQLFHILLLGLAFAQLMSDIRRNDLISISVILLLIYLTIVGVIFRRPNPRYNMPFLSILMCYAAIGGIRLFSWIKTGFLNEKNQKNLL